MKVRTRIVALIAVIIAPVFAQWRYPDASTPRTRNGKPLLTALAPRLNGKPDFSGVWEAERPRVDAHRSYTGRATPDPDNLQIDQTDANDIRRSVFFGMKREEEPLKPEAIAVLSKRQHEQPPAVRCLPQGVPGVMAVRMDSQSILYRTLYLFGIAFLAAVAVLGLLIWLTMRKGRET